MIPTEKPETPAELVHYGKKGMRWGVRNKGTSPVLTGYGPNKITRKTKSGDVISIEKYPPNALHKTLARLSAGYAKNYNKQAFLAIKDKNGKKIGNASFYKKSKDEINLVWIDIDKSSRGRGYATAVLKSAQTYAKKDPTVKRLTLEVPGNSPDAQHIYTKMGFKITKLPSDKDKRDIWGGLTEMEYIVKR